jgi:signal transduction histidine kinase
VLLNLAQNACEAAPDGSVIRFLVEDRHQEGMVRLTIHNPGEPIAPQALERLTEPFFTTKPAGTGLGLAIVKRLVGAHGGEIRFESAPGAGTRAILSLPLGV